MYIDLIQKGGAMIFEQDADFPPHDCGEELEPATIVLRRKIGGFEFVREVPGERCRICREEYVHFFWANAFEKAIMEFEDAEVGPVLSAGTPQIAVVSPQTSTFYPQLMQLSAATAG